MTKNLDIIRSTLCEQIGEHTAPERGTKSAVGGRFMSVKGAAAATRVSSLELA